MSQMYATSIGHADSPGRDPVSASSEGRSDILRSSGNVEGPPSKPAATPKPNNPVVLPPKYGCEVKGSEPPPRPTNPPTKPPKANKAPFETESGRMPEFQPGNEPGAAPKPIPPPPPPDPVRPPPPPPSHSAIGSSGADELEYNSAGALYEESALTDGGTTSPQIELPLKPDADYKAPCAPLSSTKGHPTSPLVPPRPETPLPPPAPKNHNELNGHQPPPPPVTPPPSTPKNKVVLPKVQALKFGPDEAPKPVPPKPHPDPVPAPPPPPQCRLDGFSGEWPFLNGIEGVQELLKIVYELGGHKPPPPPTTPPPKPPKTSKFGPGGPPKPLPPHPDPVRPPPRPHDLLYQPGSLCAYANEWSCRSAHRVLGGRELEFATSLIAAI